MVRLSAYEYLLPRVTHQLFLARDGNEHANTVVFSACREYLGESTVSFGERPAAGATGVRPAAKGLELPAGLPMSIELATAVDSDSASGDRIQGRLLNDVVDPVGHSVLLHEGATLDGRLMRVEVHHLKPVEFTISLRWETIEVDGVKTPLWLAPNRRMATPEATKGLLRPRGVPITLPLAGEERYQSYSFPGSHVSLFAGFRTEWLTASPW
jgi:hypothetical protein